MDIEYELQGRNNLVEGVARPQRKVKKLPPLQYSANIDIESEEMILFWIFVEIESILS